MKIFSINRRASHDYHILETIECGIVLNANEVKGIVNNLISINEAFARIDDGEVWLLDCDIQPYKTNIENYESKKKRKLLLKRQEIDKTLGKSTDKGFTLIPTKVYANDKGKIKVELAIVKGKKNWDKRNVLKTKEMKKAMERK